MKCATRLGTGLALGLAAIASVLLGAAGVVAQDDALVRTVTVLAHASGASTPPAVVQPGAELAIAANARKDPVNWINLIVDLGGLPQGASIEQWTLRLQVSTPGASRQLVRVFPGSPPGSRPRAVGMVEVTKNQKVVDIPLIPLSRERWVDVSARIVSLTLQSVTPSVKYTYRGACAFGAPCADPGRQPRLIVRYTLPAPAVPIEWPQPDHDAQHSRRMTGRPAVDVGEVTIRPVYAPGGFIVGAPVMATPVTSPAGASPRVLMLHTQETDAGSRKNFITMVYENGARGPQIDIGAPAKFSPLPDRRGQGWVVTENDLLGFPHDLSTSVVTSRRSWEQLLGGSASVRAQPTLGTDDALYLSTDRGVYAMTLYPSPRVWWRVGGADAQFGPVALSPDEATAFVVDGAAGELVALDNTDARVLWRRSVLAKFAKDAALPIPVVALQSAETKNPAAQMRRETRTLVWVVGGRERGASLQVFDGATGQSAAIGTPGYFSRPVVSSNGSVKVVRQDQVGSPGRLCDYQAQFVAPHALLRENCPAASPADLSTLSVLASDGQNNAYLIDGTSDLQKVRAYRPDFGRLFALDVPATRSGAAGSSTNIGQNLLVGPDGTLFASNANALFAIEPKRQAHSAPPAVIPAGAPPHRPDPASARRPGARGIAAASSMTGE